MEPSCVRAQLMLVLAAQHAHQETVLGKAAAEILGRANVGPSHSLSTARLRRTSAFQVGGDQTAGFPHNDEKKHRLCLHTEPVIFEGDFKLQSGQQAVNHLPALKQRPTAIIAANDLMAWSVARTRTSGLACFERYFRNRL